MCIAYSELLNTWVAIAVNVMIYTTIIWGYSQVLQAPQEY